MSEAFLPSRRSPRIPLRRTDPPSAARIFLLSLPPSSYPHIHSLKVSLHGSLAATGMGHMTPHATLLGLMGEDPETVPVGRLERVMQEVREARGLGLGLRGGEVRNVRFELDKDLVSWPRKGAWGELPGTESLVVAPLAA